MKVFFGAFAVFSLLDWIGGLVTWFAKFVFPIRDFLAIVVALVICDLITGIIAAKKRKESIQAVRMEDTVRKLVLYFIAILLSEGMKATFVPPFPITYVTALAISVTEFKSNIENIEFATNTKVWMYLKEHLAGVLKKK